MNKFLAKVVFLSFVLTVFAAIPADIIICPVIDCPPPTVYSPNTCGCICPPFDCIPPKIFSLKTCSCICPNVCPLKNFIQNKITCECECAQVLKCPTFKVFDYKTCSCVCKKEILCKLPLVFNPNSCTCTCPPVMCPTGQIPLLPGCQCGKPVLVAVNDTVPAVA